jgi:uncharacterized protein DUF6867
MTMPYDLHYGEESWGVFVLVTVLLGGGAAWLAGSAIAQTWRPWWSIVAYMLLLGFAVRFLHFALFSGTLLSPLNYAIDTFIAMCLASGGFRLTRRKQMAHQYGFLNKSVSPSAARQDAAP